MKAWAIKFGAATDIEMPGTNQLKSATVAVAVFSCVWRQRKIRLTICTKPTDLHLRFQAGFHEENEGVERADGDTRSADWWMTTCPKAKCT